MNFNHLVKIQNNLLWFQWKLSWTVSSPPTRRSTVQASCHNGNKLSLLLENEETSRNCKAWDGYKKKWVHLIKSYRRRKYVCVLSVCYARNFIKEIWFPILWRYVLHDISWKELSVYQKKATCLVVVSQTRMRDLCIKNEWKETLRLEQLMHTVHASVKQLILLKNDLRFDCDPFHSHPCLCERL